MDHGSPGESDHRVPQKSEMRVAIPMAKRARVSCHLLSHHHKGLIAKVPIHLWMTSPKQKAEKVICDDQVPAMQNLLDCTVPSEEEKSTILTHL